ncbi:MAG TPA: hypothetical protein VGT08_00030 [Terracidiphilus sp.]|nr:hypothetical protein [Terracidiphilus sp.]
MRSGSTAAVGLFTGINLIVSLIEALDLTHDGKEEAANRLLAYFRCET